ncbi:MAG: shikimate kinase, partial [Clostridia bacterium]|nr:shikimate kinase [Clostridia bacterium]
MTVTLIGMPGVGKSCMGKVLARRMKLKLIDGDKLIEQNTG